jgi:uncharacterized membrane protein
MSDNSITINSTITTSMLNDLKRDVTFLSDHWIPTEARLEDLIINPRIPSNTPTKDLIKIQEDYDKKLLKLYRDWKKGYAAILQVLE